MGKWNNKNQLYFIQVDVSVSRSSLNIMVSHSVRRVASFNAPEVKLELHMLAFCVRIRKLHLQTLISLSYLKNN